MSISLLLARILPWVVIAILAVNLSQRRHMATGERKRHATLYWAVLVLATLGFALVLQRFLLPDWLLIPFLGVLAALAALGRRRLFVFRLRCARCGRPLSPGRFLYHDDDLCDRCAGGG